MPPTTVVLVTGHPAAGKTTFARYLAKQIGLPALCKDDMKEILFDKLGWSTYAWTRQLGVAAWALLYQQVTMLLEAHIGHIVEANFDPQYDNPHWQRLTKQFDVQVIQVRCECEPDVLLERDRERVRQGTRHPGHLQVGEVDESAYREVLEKGPIGWIEVEGERISLDTTRLAVEEYGPVVKRIVEIGCFVA